MPADLGSNGSSEQEQRESPLSVSHLAGENKNTSTQNITKVIADSDMCQECQVGIRVGQGSKKIPFEQKEEMDQLQRMSCRKSFISKGNGQGQGLR